MKIYTLHKKQNLPISVEKAWAFLSDPVNLKSITPEYMGFDIISGADRPMYPGQIIQYIVTPILGIKTKLRWSSEFDKVLDGQNERLIEICKKCDVNIYFTGPSGKNYLNEKVFNDNNIKIEWMNYNNYPNYNQLFKPNDYNVSILDLIFNEGDQATNYMLSFN